ncbi:MAG TPA: M28 family peptidase [Polyangiaceae bacterium]|nr:M28 family peptidase [Polyangiaceae bacterium]
MMTSTRVPLFILMLALAACGENELTAIADDAGSTEDGADDAGSSADGSDDAPFLDAPRGIDGASRNDGTPRVDGASGADTTNRVDALSDAGSRIDAAADVGEAGSAPDARSDAVPPSCPGVVDPEFLREKLSKLSGELPVQIGGMEATIPERYTAANRALARQFLMAEYQALGFAVTEHTYASGANVVATRTGADGKFLVLSGHYDTVRESVPGADDDGTGIIGSLATAKALEGCQLDHGIRILAFDQEESGALGSKAYVSQLQSSGELDDFIGDVQFEMAGYHTKQDGGFLLVDCRSSEGDRPESKFLNDAVLSAIARGNLALEPHDACVGSSDHGTFWTAGKPAIVFSEEFSFSGANANPCYHKECDTVSFVNFDYFAKMTTLSVLVTADLVGAH